jgi:Glycosyl hydrolase family 3 C-terminal domain
VINQGVTEYPELSLKRSCGSPCFNGQTIAVVLINGSALAVNWINEHANAIVEAWYPGEESGSAVAETLSGKNNPAGWPLEKALNSSMSALYCWQRLRTLSC